MRSEGIEVYDLAYSDGTSPPDEIVDEWFKLLKKQFHENPDACVAVHCIAGLGRAPVMVALALIELGLKYEEAVELIREYVDLLMFNCRHVVYIFLYLFIGNGEALLIRSSWPSYRNTVRSRD